MLHRSVPPAGQKDDQLLSVFELLPNSPLSLLAVPFVHCEQLLITADTVPLLFTFAQTRDFELHKRVLAFGAGPLLSVRSIAWAIAPSMRSAQLLATTVPFTST